MRLTKSIKQAIVTSIMNDVPKHIPNLEEGKRKLQEAVVKAMSPDVRKLYKSKPSALAKEYVHGYSHGFDSTFYVIAGDVDIKPILEPYRKEHDERQAVRIKIKGIVEGCNTTTQLRKLLPEFDKYIPTDAEPAKNLPAVANVVSDLTKMGWPKQGEPK